MYIFNIISLLGGLALFLYGMRLMSSTIKEGSSGTLKKIMEKMTNNPFKAFLLGVLVTAIIQSSTATIVITSGLVAAGLIKFKHSVGIIMGANVGTTVTGQIIRLLDINASSGSWLQIFKPSTLAPAALIAGIILIMFMKFKNSDSIGNVCMGFGILFTGLLNMTNSVSVLNEMGIFDKMFAGLGDSPVLGYLTGAGVAFILQSSSATIGILQAFSSSGQILFKAIYSIIVGIYLGDCLTTAIVCSIGAKADSRRVGLVNIMFNLSETVLVVIVMNILHSFGVLDSMWNLPVNSSIIANTNTIFNFSCAVLLFPLQGVYEKLARKIIKDEPEKKNPYSATIDALNPVFLSTPAIAFNRVYEGLLIIFGIARKNIEKAFGLIGRYDENIFDEINEDENNIDILTDSISNYLVSLSKNISLQEHVQILNQYYSVVTEFERLGDHALNIAENSRELNKHNSSFSPDALREIDIAHELLEQILDYTKQSFLKRDVDAAKQIEPLEEVVDDLVNSLKERHLERLKQGICNVYTDSGFLNLLNDMERISDVCSNVGVATVIRVNPELAGSSHSYMSSLHQGNDDGFNSIYNEAHSYYFSRLDNK